MKVEYVNESTTALPLQEDSYLSPVGVIDNLTKLAALFGLLGNSLTFRTVELLPEATSKYLMKYLAVWDSMAALHGSVIRPTLYRFLSQLPLSSQVHLLTYSFHKLLFSVKFLNFCYKKLS